MATESYIQDLIDEPDDLMPWSVTYADLMTLLLVFFVLLYTLYFVQNKAYETRLASVQVAVDGDGKAVTMLDYAQASNQTKGAVLLEEVTGLLVRKATMLAEIRAAASRQGWRPQLNIIESERSFTLQLKGELMFAAGEARISAQGLAVLEVLQGSLQKYPEYRVSVHDHSDDVSDLFASLSELSGARASNVLMYLVAQGFALERLTATGYANLVLGTEQPAAAGTEDEGSSTNRRLELVLEKEI